MEQNENQHRRMYHDRHYAQPNQHSRMPRQQHGVDPRRQQAVPNDHRMPRHQQQQRSRPGPGPGRFPVAPSTGQDFRYPRNDNRSKGEDTNATEIHSTPDFAPPQAPFHNTSRHMSHISELSSTYVPTDSRPVSAIESEAEFTHSMSNYNLQTPPPSYPGHSNTSDGRFRIKSPDGGRQTTDSSTMAALSAAIRAGLAPNPSRSSTPSSKQLPLRMPFQGEPESPTSVYTTTTNHQSHLSVPFSAHLGHRRHDSKVSTISEQDAEDFEKSPYLMSEDPEKSGYIQTAEILPASRFSKAPVNMSENTGLSHRIPEGKRPARLDIVAVREAEARGSMSSLTDLIKRATKVAANLDRGRTASRLGHLDMFGSSEKLEGSRVRNSTYSDVLAAFPAPTENGTPAKERPNTLWPNTEKGFAASKSSLGRFVENANEKPKRRCCGLSPPWFVLLLLIVILLVVAAVLIPIFLIVIPNQNSAEAALALCPASHVCHNEGVKVFAGQVCSCICVNGFTGSDCSAQTAPDCGTGDFVDGTKTWTGATVGRDVLSVLQDSKDSFGLPLNSTVILSTFAYNNLSCVSENSLVDFGSSSTLRQKRLVMLSGAMLDAVDAFLDMPATERRSTEPQPSKTLYVRQEATQSANGIVFARPSETATSTFEGQGAPAESGVASSTTSAPSSTASSTRLGPTEKELSFAAGVVLYVLQSFPELNVAVSSKQAIAAHFSDASSTNGTVEIVSGSQSLQADFETFQIIYGNGTTIGHG